MVEVIQYSIAVSNIIVIFNTGTILGITNGFGNIPGWLAPLTAGAFTQNSVNIIRHYVIGFKMIIMLLFIAFSVECNTP